MFRDGGSDGSRRNSKTNDKIADSSSRKYDEQVSGSQNIVQDEYQEEKDCNEG
jgi:hypothetical protein